VGKLCEFVLGIVGCRAAGGQHSNDYSLWIIDYLRIPALAGYVLNRPLDFQAVSQLHHRKNILFAISAKLQKLFVNRYNQAFFTNS
jgi:hypothetical protein